MVSIWKNSVSSPSSLHNRYLWNFPFEEIPSDQSRSNLFGERKAMQRVSLLIVDAKKVALHISVPHNPYSACQGRSSCSQVCPSPSCHKPHIMFTQFWTSSFLLCCQCTQLIITPKSQNRCTCAQCPHPLSPKAEGFPSCWSQLSCSFLKGTTPTTPTQGRPPIPGPFCHWALFTMVPVMEIVTFQHRCLCSVAQCPPCRVYHCEPSTAGYFMA